MKNLILFFLFASSPAWAQSRFDGTWEMKMDTLEFTGPPEVYVIRDGVFRCLSCIPKWETKADGSRHAVTGPLHFDAASIHIVNSNAVEFAYWKNGQPTFACTETVSPDGKSMIEEFTETPSSERVTGHATFGRVGDGPPGSHALSGSWEMHTVKNVSRTGPLQTYHTAKDRITVTAGQEHFEATLDGKDHPMPGDHNPTVSIKLIDESTMEETSKRDGKVTGVSIRTVSPDGKSMRVRYTDKENGKTMIYTAKKQP